MNCVTEISRGKFYFPPNVPRPRQCRSEKTLIYLSLLCIFIGYYFIDEKDFTKTILFIGSFICVFVFTSFIIELVRRCCLLVEEVHHVGARYQNSTSLMLKRTFHPSPVSLFFLFLTTFVWIVIIFVSPDIKSPWVLLYQMGPGAFVCSLISMLLLEPFLQLRSSPLYDALSIQRRNGLNYGAGMASSFYHGYLDLMLPKTGGEEASLDELIQNYSDNETVRFADYKLFVLIPQSCECHVSLKDHSPSIDEASSLGEKIRTVAGVRDRVYKNSVYRIKDRKGDKIYVCAEFATPLKTFMNVINSQSQYAEFYKTQKYEIVLQFYLTLKKILEENSSSRHLCELIYYDDKNEAGEYYDVGQIILQRLAFLKKRKQQNKKDA